MEPTFLNLLALGALTVANSFFFASWMALDNAPKQALRDQADENRSAKVASTLADDPERPLRALQIADVVSQFLVASMIALIVWPVASRVTGLAAPLADLLFVLTGALILCFFSRVVAGNVAMRDPTAWLRHSAFAIQATTTFFLPITLLMNGLRQTLLGDEMMYQVTQQEIMEMVEAGEEEGAIEQEERKMIDSVLRLDDTVAREVMIPRIDIVAIEIDTPFDQVLDTVIKKGHSRIPVYNDSLDHIEGLLYAKDLLEVWANHKDGKPFSLRDLLRPALFVPESKPVSDLLKELQTARVHLAMVIDEYGGTAGLVTIEDIVEEIVGEIVDEYDASEEALYNLHSESEYVFDGRIDLDDLNRLLDVDLSKDMGDTLGGYIYGHMGKVPDPGDVLATEGMLIEVLSIEDRRIRKVRVKLERPGDDSSPVEEEKDGNGKNRR